MTQALEGVIVRRPGEFVAEIVLDRPAAMNALNTAMAESIATVCKELAADREVRAVVLSAAGTKAFCAGADLKERDTMTDAEILRQREVFRAAFGGVLRLPQPTVAAVHGWDRGVRREARAALARGVTPAGGRAGGASG